MCLCHIHSLYLPYLGMIVEEHNTLTTFIINEKGQSSFLLIFAHQMTLFTLYIHTTRKSVFGDTWCSPNCKKLGFIWILNFYWTWYCYHDHPYHCTSLRAITMGLGFLPAALPTLSFLKHYYRRWPTYILLDFGPPSKSNLSLNILKDFTHLDIFPYQQPKSNLDLFST